MSKRTKLLGAACGLAAAFIVGPASANTLTGFAGDLYGNYGRLDVNHCTSCAFNQVQLGGDVAMPLSDVSNLNLQLGAAYEHNWRSRSSFEDWNFDGAVFWAGTESRFGVSGNYNTFTHSGYTAGGGLFGEMYFGNVTGALKAGWTQGGGSGGCITGCTATTTAGPLFNSGGSGAYFGVMGAAYVTPDLGVTAGFDYENDSHGYACTFCTRTGVKKNTYFFEGEYMVNEQYSTAVYGNFSFSNVHTAIGNFDATTFRFGLRWYTGGGSLIDKHRNGTLHPWLAGR